jgi:glycerophosphoryl diester phosphodiesterase
LTKDGYLVANHDPTLLESTDVSEYASLFKNRMKSLVVISGSTYKDDYEIIDFTLAELQMLKRRQRYDFRSTYTNEKYNMVSLDEIISQVNLLNDDFPRRINNGTKVGLYIEIKNYDWYLSEHNIDMAEQLFKALNNHGLGTIGGCSDVIPIVIQSFFQEALVKFATLSDLPLVLLMHYSAS